MRVRRRHLAPLAQVIVKAEHTELGPNTRFVVTDLDAGDEPQGLYDGLYCVCGEMENRIKDQQLGCSPTRRRRATLTSTSPASF